MKNLTELVFILDRSGSMAGLETDTIGGFNGPLTAQKQLEGRALVTTVLFDDQYELLHDRIDLQGVNLLTAKDYYVRGCTALLDAIGRTVAKIKTAQEHTKAEQRPDKTLFTIITDGYENASSEYTFAKVKQVLVQQQECGWEFVFIGANIDAIATASRMGIRRDRAANYVADKDGVECCYEAVKSMNMSFRSGEGILDDWDQPLQADVRKRGRRGHRA